MQIFTVRINNSKFSHKLVTEFATHFEANVFGWLYSVTHKDENILNYTVLVDSDWNLSDYIFTPLVSFYNKIKDAFDVEWKNFDHQYEFSDDSVYYNRKRKEFMFLSSIKNWLEQNKI